MSTSSLNNAVLMEQACKLIPGGVNSPVRAFGAVGGTPPFVAHARGAYMWDAEDRQLIDYIGSWGPAILGHGHPQVLAAVQAALEGGFSFGAPTARETELAAEVQKLMPSVKMLRMVSSGTEAGMSAIRLARGATGRDLIIKFEGCYHGHADSLLVKAGSGLATFGNPTSAGVPEDLVRHTLVLEYNNTQQLQDAFTRYGDQVACLIMEPIAGNMNFVRASTEFTAACRQLCTRHGALLVYDEVMTGFRVALGGAQSLYAQKIDGFVPDLTLLGKVIGGGMPLAAFGGRADIMKQLAPLGPVYQAGTLSGNPIATACGLATLKQIQSPGFHAGLAEKTKRLTSGLKQAADKAGIPFSADSEGGMFGYFFLPTLPQNYQQVTRTDLQRFGRFYHGMLDAGIYLAPGLYEANFMSAAHTLEDVRQTIQAGQDIFDAWSESP